MRVVALAVGLALALFTMSGIVRAEGAPPGGQFVLNIGLPTVAGDMDWSGAVSREDVLFFELALTNPTQYESLLSIPPTVTTGAQADGGLIAGASATPELPDWLLRGDMNNDGTFDTFDIQPFYNQVFGVPEPSTAALASLAGCILFAARFRPRRTARAGRIAA